MLRRLEQNNDEVLYSGIFSVFMKLRCFLQHCLLITSTLYRRIYFSFLHLGYMHVGEIIGRKYSVFFLAILTPGDIDSMIQEAIKMKSFSNLNVLGLVGVCVDAGEAPYIVMPYMANGSLLAYLRKERVNLTIAVGASEEVVSC